MKFTVVQTTKLNRIHSCLLTRQCKKLTTKSLYAWIHVANASLCERSRIRILFHQIISVLEDFREKRKKKQFLFKKIEKFHFENCRYKFLNFWKSYSHQTRVTAATAIHRFPIKKIWRKWISIRSVLGLEKLAWRSASQQNLNRIQSKALNVWIIYRLEKVDQRGEIRGILDKFRKIVVRRFWMKWRELFDLICAV